MAAPSEPVIVPEPLGGLVRSWEIHLRAERKSPRTLRVYLGTVATLADYLTRNGYPTDPRKITADHLRGFFTEQLERLAPKTVHVRHSYLAVFFRWLEDEGELDTENTSGERTPGISPMRRIKAPKLDDVPPPIVTDEQYNRMLHAVRGTTFEDRRDTAILRLLWDSGLRRAECADLQTKDVNLRDMTATVMGKGRQERTVPFTPETARAIDRYMRERSRRRYHGSGSLFLARTGPISPNAIGEVVYRAARLAGYVDASGRELVSPHMFRHGVADRWKRDGGSEDGLMALGGWRNRDVMARYGRKNAASRMIEEYRRLRG